MKFLFDLFPVLLFFVVYKIASMFPGEASAFVQQYMSGMMNGGAGSADHAPILVATLVAMVASVIQISWVVGRGRKVDAMLWLSVIVIVVFGGATIYFNDETFIKWKPTILNWIYGGVLLIAQLGFRKNLLREMMGKALALPTPVWDRLGLAWSAFFLLVGAVNLLVAFVIYKGDTAAWVNFKTFGLVGLTFAFAIGQSVYVSRYVEEEKA